METDGCRVCESNNRPCESIATFVRPTVPVGCLRKISPTGYFSTGATEPAGLTTPWPLTLILGCAASETRCMGDDVKNGLEEGFSSDGRLLKSFGQSRQ